jgi:hypothetical protein
MSSVCRRGVSYIIYLYMYINTVAYVTYVEYKWCETHLKKNKSLYLDIPTTGLYPIDPQVRF